MNFVKSLLEFLCKVNNKILKLDAKFAYLRDFHSALVPCRSVPPPKQSIRTRNCAEDKTI